MNPFRRHAPGVWRHVLLTLATLAVALKVLIPAGFMAGQPTNGLPFALVLCTGQGAIVVQPGERLPSHGDDAPASQADNGGPCLFAGHAAAAAPPALADLGVVEFVAYAFHPRVISRDLAPGRGLTGPPLPARGPPAQLI